MRTIRASRTRTFGLGITALATVAALGACSSTTASSDDSPSSSACPTVPGVTASTITIGAVFPKSGAAAATFTGFDTAAKLRFDQENAAGGINGRTIVVSSYDDQASGAQQTVVANKMTQQDSVFGVVAASVTDTMYPMLKEKGIPVAGLGNLPPYTADPNAFGAYGPYAPGFGNTSGPQRMADAGATKIAVLNHVSPAAESSADAFADSVPSVGGEVVLRKADLPLGSYDATSTALLIKKSGADGVYEVVLPEGGVAIGQAMKQQGLDPAAVYIPAMTDPEVIKQAAGPLEGVISSGYGTVPVTLDAPAVKGYFDGMTAGGLSPYLPLAPVGFLSADILVKGLQAAGPCPTREAVISALRAVTDYDGGGMLPGPVSFAPGLVPNGTPSNCTWFVTIHDGVGVPDEQATCGETIDLTTGKAVS